MQLQAAIRRWQTLHEDKPFHNGTFDMWSEKQTKRTPFHYLDGVSIWLSEVDLTPDDDFLEQASASSGLRGVGQRDDPGGSEARGDDPQQPSGTERQLND